MQKYETIMDLCKTQQGASQLASLASCNLEETIRELKSEFPSCFSCQLKTPEGLFLATKILKRTLKTSGDYDVTSFEDLDLILIVYFGSNL